MSVVLGVADRAHAMLGPVHHAHRYLEGNQLSGSIPDTIDNLNQVQQLCVGCCVLVYVVELACGCMGNEGVGDECWRAGAALGAC